MAGNIRAAAQAFRAGETNRAEALRQAAERAQRAAQNKEASALRRRQMEIAESREARESAEFAREEATAERRAQIATPEQREYYAASLPADLRERLRPAIMAPEFTVGQGEDMLEQYLRDTKYSRGSSQRGGGGTGGVGTGGGGGNNYEFFSDVGNNPSNWSPRQLQLYQILGSVADRQRFAMGYRPEGWEQTRNPDGSVSLSPEVAGDPVNRRNASAANAEIRRMDRIIGENQGGNRNLRRARTWLANRNIILGNIVGPNDRATAFVWTGDVAPTANQRSGIETAINEGNALAGTMRRYRTNAAEIQRLAPESAMRALAADLMSRGSTAESIAELMAQRYPDADQQNLRDLAEAIAAERVYRQQLIRAIREIEVWGAQTLGEQSLAESQLPATPNWRPAQVPADVHANDIDSISLQSVNARAAGVQGFLNGLINTHTQRVPNVYVVEGGPAGPMTGRRLQNYVAGLIARADGGDQGARDELDRIRISLRERGGN